jgi:hypothetical protein
MSEEEKWQQTLNEILFGKNGDPMGLLSDVQPAAQTAKATSPVEQNFQEINDFYEEHLREPDIQSTEILEHRLAARLQSYKSRPALANAVRRLDVYGLLKEKTGEACTQNSEQSTVPHSLDDILSNDETGLLGQVDPSIYKIEHVRNQAPDQRNWPEEIASRKPCEDFYKFEKLFRDVERGIANRQVQTARFQSERQVNPGDIFILSGLLCYVDGVLKKSEGAKRRSVSRVRENPRLRVIFENGVETNILKRSLARALYKDPHGRRIIPSADSVVDGFRGITSKDHLTGCIYVLASETKSPVLADLKRQGRLVKIGFSTQAVEERIRNAEKDPTYLEAPVRILASLDCYNLNPQKVEHLIHAFLAKQRINMTLISSKGEPYKPTEWFAVDRDTAIAVAQHIVADDIMEYRMDNTTGRLKKIS